MNFNQLSDFISRQMRMSHVYQPVMLLALLKNNGSSTENEIAKSILEHDESQVEYYQNITNNMVGRVLRNHGIVVRDKKRYRLEGYEQLTQDQIDSLIQRCELKLQEYIDKRGEQIWQHRKKSAGYISGTIRYEILKRAKFHCELCGISADIKALEVDHILPRNHGGTDESENLQALCYSCNAMKRDRDDTNFSKIRESFKHREHDCLFCNPPIERVIVENNLSYVIYDAYPVTTLHTLIIPKRHASTYFDLGQSEINAINQLLNQLKDDLIRKDSSISGFNVGMNCGETAGQTVMHAHIHLIPRRDGDVGDPRGGVRHLIAGKGYY